MSENKHVGIKTWAVCNHLAGLGVTLALMLQLCLVQAAPRGAWDHLCKGLACLCAGPLQLWPPAHLVGLGQKEEALALCPAEGMTEASLLCMLFRS